jgi:transglutaminase-like putative cysteine protease
MNDITLNPRKMLWLLATLTLVAAPHTERLPWWVTGLFVVLLMWRIYLLGHSRLPLPHKWLLLLIVATATVGIYLHYRNIFGRDPGVTLLIVMLALKTLETRTIRDGMLLIFLSYFLIITTFFFSQTILTAIYMLGCVWVITAGMLGLHYTRHPGYRTQLRSAGVLLAQAVPLMLALFLFFPRVQGPLWGLPQDAYSGVSGLSDTMAPGSLSNLSLSDAVAFRVNFAATPPPPKQLYWRGPVLWDFDGRTWTAPRRLYGVPRYQTTSQPITYDVIIEPHNKRWLFALELPGRLPPRSQATIDFQLISNTPVTQRLRYAMVSYPETGYGIDEAKPLLARATRLPSDFNPRTLALAQSLRAKFSDDRALMREVLALFRNQNFFYTLTPPPLGTNSVDEFLFDTKSGFCEHYASAFAVLMRAAGIPTRIVTGYLGGEINPVGNYMIVRQADAHAWTEVWISGTGWVRVDPTAAVSPLRVESGIGAAVPRTDPLPMMARGDYQWLRQARLTWDSMSNSWNQWVLGYNPERQRSFMSRVGIDDATWRTLTVILIATTGIIMLALTLITLRRLRKAVRDPVKLAYERFCAKLGRKGLPRDPAEGPLDYAARLARLRPNLAPGIAAITQLYIALRYGNYADRQALQELKREVGRFQA